MIDVLKSRLGGKWDGEPPEIHGLLEVGGKKLKVELMYIAATGKWQCCVFEGGEVATIELGEEPVVIAAKAVAKAL